MIANKEEQVLVGLERHFVKIGNRDLLARVDLLIRIGLPLRGILGAIELLGLLHGGPSVDLNLLGYAIVGLFVATWAIALAVWRVGRIEERWAVHLDQA